VQHFRQVDSGTQGSRLPAAGHLKRQPEIRHFPVDSIRHKLGQAPELGGVTLADRDRQTHRTCEGYVGTNVLIGSDRLHRIRRITA
jgi:hypothetical protein